jgi:hypothetical protein
MSDDGHVKLWKMYKTLVQTPWFSWGEQQDKYAVAESHPWNKSYVSPRTTQAETVYYCDWVKSSKKQANKLTEYKVQHRWLMLKEVQFQTQLLKVPAKETKS